MPSKRKKYSARFPPARIKKIMQTDEEVGKVAAAVPVVISRALELFIESLIIKTGETTMSKNAKTLTPTHIKQTIQGEKKFDFLHDLVATVPDHQAEDDGDLSQHGDQKKQKVPRQKRQKGEGKKGRKRKNNSDSSDEETEENNDTNDDDECTETDEEQAQDSESSSSRGAYSRTESMDVFHPSTSNSVSDEPLNLCSYRGAGEGYQPNMNSHPLPRIHVPAQPGMLHPYADMRFPAPNSPNRTNNLIPSSADYYNKSVNSEIPGFGVPTNMCKSEPSSDCKDVLNLSSVNRTVPSSDGNVPPVFMPAVNTPSSFGPAVSPVKSSIELVMPKFSGIPGGFPSTLKQNEDDDYDS